MKRYGSVVKVKPECLEKYKELHANAWPEVLQKIKKCNIQNYSIYYRNGYLFSYFEYTGNDFETDMAKMASDSITQQWWSVCKLCLEPLEGITIEQCWAPMEEVFYTD